MTDGPDDSLPASDVVVSGSLDALAELALDMRSAWNHATDEVWRQLDPVLWDLTQNPWVVLQTVSRATVEQALDDPEFCRIVDDLIQARRSEVLASAWFQKVHPRSPLRCVAYFSMEYMLSEALPIYSGGLGNVAGDHLKAASDLGIPVIGIGLLYQQGYFRQLIEKDGTQQALFPYNDPGQLPITPLRRANGEWLRLEIALPGYSVWLRTWQVQIGRVKLYLLDSNDAANFPAYRGITSELYGGDAKLRIEQELMLGIGGWRLLHELGIEPDICHLNEGHAAFAILERAGQFMATYGVSFAAALAVTRAGNLFTTHTAVAAGFDHFAPALIERYLSQYAQEVLRISCSELLALGRLNPDDADEPFNMAYLAIRGSGALNAVSSLHGRVSRHLFSALFPRWPYPEIPVGHITNGVHMPTWDSARADTLWTDACGKQRWQGSVELLGSSIRCVADVDLWRFRTRARQDLIDFARARLARQLRVSGVAGETIEQLASLFDSNTLTLGFARRFAEYKRPNLLLHDPARLLRILTDTQRPVQLIIAGKAHPKDVEGQRLIQQWMQFIWRPEARRHVIFLSDYDMHLTEHLVQGVDVWLNTPRRPWEACGTSGMKVLVNGGINVSELDGWWAEAYTPAVGWALGDGREHNDPAHDAVEAQALYGLLESEVIPEFYARDEQGLPTTWVARIRESMATLTPQFSTNRSACEYTEKYYIPLASTYAARVSAAVDTGAAIVAWQRMLDRHWPALRFGDVRCESRENQHFFAVQIYLDGLDPQAVQMQLYADGGASRTSVCIAMTCSRELVGADGGYVFSVAVPDDRPAGEFTPRLVPYREGVAVPLEENRILWAR